jgi:hypothetical protein
MTAQFFKSMKPTNPIIQFLNGEIPEDRLFELVPERHDLIAGFKEVHTALTKVFGTKVITVCAICGTAILRRRVLAGRPNYCDAERCKKIQKLGQGKPVTLNSAPVPARNCLREIRTYNGGYSE